MISTVENKNLYSNPFNFEKQIKLRNKNIICDPQGNFYVEKRVITLIKKIISKILGDVFGWETKKQIGWAKGLIYVFDQLEQNKQEINKSLYEGHLKTAKTVKAILKKNANPLVSSTLQELKRKTVSLKCRLGASYSLQYNKTSKTEIDSTLALLASEWKKEQVVFKSHSVLSPKDHAQLQKLMEYPKFVELIKNNRVLREDFFNWALLFPNRVDVFIQFPKAVKKLIDSGLYKRIGRYGGDDLRIEEYCVDGKIFKDLTLPFEGVRYSILDEKKKINFSYQYTLSVGEVFEIFEARSYKVGNLEYFGEGRGIVNWNPFEWGAYNPVKNDYERVDINDPEFINKAPYSEKISEAEAQERFEDKEGKKLLFGPQDWVFSVVAKNAYRHANPTGTHAMLCIAIPNNDGQRRLYYLSKFPSEFPHPEREKKKYFRIAYDTVKASLQLPDENFYQLDRDEEWISWKASPQEAAITVERIRKDKLLSQRGLLFFQFLIYNCTDWVFKKIRHLVPPQERDEIAAMWMWDAKPEDLSRKLFSLPQKIRKRVLDLSVKVAQPIGQRKQSKTPRSKIIQLTTLNGPWNEGILRLHPAMVILRKREKKLKTQSLRN